MNIERLNYFSDLAITHNFTETAENFFTTQGNISKHIMALEHELNTTLFYREHRKITLTNAGKTLLPHAQKVLSDYDTLQKALHPFQNSTGAMLKIYVIPIMVNYNITGLIAEFHQNYPNILLDLKEIESIRLLKELNQGHCDIAYIRIFEMDYNKYEKITVEAEQFAAVLPNNHPLAKKDLIHLIELKDEEFYQLDKNTQLFNQFYTLCQRAGFKPNVGYTGTRIDNILDFISNGMGISLMMKNSIQSLNHKGIVIIPLDITVESELAFVRLKHQHPSPATNYLWKFLCRKFISKTI